MLFSFEFNMFLNFNVLLCGFFVACVKCVSLKHSYTLRV